MKGWDAPFGSGPTPGPKNKEVKKMKMVCTVCGKEAEYNEKLNVYYCREHGFTTWIKNDEIVHENIHEVTVSEEAVLG